MKLTLDLVFATLIFTTIIIVYCAISSIVFTIPKHVGNDILAALCRNPYFINAVYEEDVETISKIVKSAIGNTPYYLAIRYCNGKILEVGDKNVMGISQGVLITGWKGNSCEVEIWLRLIG